MKSLRLEVELFILHYGRLPVLGLILLAVAGWLSLLATPQVRALTSQWNQEIAKLESASLPKPHESASLLEQRHRRFREYLLPRESLPDALKAIFSNARKNGLVLQQGDYALNRVPGGGYLVYRLKAPVRGSYGAIRQFMQDVLMNMPSAALEEASFRRTGSDTAETEAKLVIAIYLREGR